MIYYKVGDNMKEDLKTILYMGLGALVETSDKMKEVKEELFTKGQELYEKGLVTNEELKHNLKEAMKENVTVIHPESNNTKEEILKSISKLSAKDQEEILSSLNKKKWADKQNGKGNKKES